jgi:L-threonylcarbamoyladenylate synthase
MVTKEDIAKAVAILRSGGLVAFPTETVYGLGANALDAEAVRKIFALKGRPSTSPLIVHVASIAQARDLALEWPDEAERLASEYWPGPLTLVVPKNTIVPDEVTAGLPTVGLRIPRHPVALELLQAVNLPIAAPSANRFTQLSPTTAQHVREAFGASTPFLLDGGPCEVGIESTVVAVTKDGMEVLRPGMAFVGKVEKLEKTVTATEPASEAHRAPGQHPKHYSPRTRVLLVSGGRLPDHGDGAYLYLHAKATATVAKQMPADPKLYAAQLYTTLHELDTQHFDWIAVEMPPHAPEWTAIRDRLTRAAY